MAIEVSVNSVVRQRWDDVTRFYYEFDTSGVQTLARAYTTQENIDADGRATDLTRATNLANLYQQAQGAFSTNTTFLGLSAPTNAQVVAQVQALTRQSSKVIHVLLGVVKGDPTALDSTN